MELKSLYEGHSLLIINPENKIKRVIRYNNCGLPLEEKCYNEHKEAHYVRTEWFSGTEIISTVEEFKNDIRHGKSVAYYMYGNVKSILNYHEGRYHGKCVTFSINNKKIMENTYIHGSMIHSIKYNIAGHITSLTEYENEKKYHLVEYNGKEDQVIVNEVLYDYYQNEIPAVDYKDRRWILGSGELIVYKACVAERKFVIVTLRVPAEARRVSPPNQLGKSRIEFGYVISIKDKFNNEYKSAKSFLCGSDNRLEYKVGEKVIPDNFDNSVFNVSSNGINVHTYKDHCLIWKHYFNINAWI